MAADPRLMDAYARQHGFADAATMMGYYRTKQGIMQGNGAQAPATWGAPQQPIMQPHAQPAPAQSGGLSGWLNALFGRISGAMNGNK